MMPSIAEIIRLRSGATVDCSVKMPYLKQGIACKALEAPCLFNVKDDPCERYNLAKNYPNILNSILQELERFNGTAVPPSNKPLNPKADPRLWDNTWTNFGDFDESKDIIAGCIHT